jgi:tripartite-type tricarboxylate transporter receptor subunit TctC
MPPRASVVRAGKALLLEGEGIFSSIKAHAECAGNPALQQFPCRHPILTIWLNILTNRSKLGLYFLEKRCQGLLNVSSAQLGKCMKPYSKVVFFLLLMAGGACAQAAGFPDRPVNLIVGFTPGTSVDIVARILAQKLGTLWGQTIIVENKAGAGGNIGASYVARSAPDGYTILLANNSVAISDSLYRKLSYDPLHDLKGVTQISAMPFALVVAPSFPASTLQELIAQAKSKPGQLTFGSGGVGNADHMASELFTHMAGIKMEHVPYRGGTEALTDTMAGRISMYFPGVAAGLPLIADGRVKALATSGAKRSKALPNVPTFSEAGVTGYQVTLWNGFMVPSKTPQAVVDKISDDTNRVLQMPDVVQRFSQLGLDSEPSSPKKFEDFYASEIRKWADVVKTTGIQLQ